MKKAQVFLTILAALYLCILNANEDNSDSIKASIIYRLTNYIEWPLKKNNHVFKVFVYKDPGVSKELAKILKGKSIRGRTILIINSNDLKQIDSAQMVIIGKVDKKEIISIINKTKNQPIVLVCQADGVLKYGATVNFYKKDGKLNFEINKKATNKRGLRLHSVLHDLAGRPAD